MRLKLVWCLAKTLGVAIDATLFREVFLQPATRLIPDEFVKESLFIFRAFVYRMIRSSKMFIFNVSHRMIRSYKMIDS